MVNLPAFFTSVVASAAKSSSTFEHCAFFKPLLAANTSAMPVFDIAFFFIAFMAFTMVREVERTSNGKWPGTGVVF